MSTPMVRSRSLTEEHLETWRRDGYCIVEQFILPETVQRTVDELHTIVPTWDQFRSEPDAWPDATGLTWMDFPYRVPMMNHLVLNPELISFARRALETDDVVLSHSESMAKYADSDVDFDQRLHMDYQNNTFVVPLEDDFEQLASITYLTDVTLDMGPTKVVSYEDGEPWSHQAHWSPTDAPELFTKERAITVPAGSIFLYSMRTLHRGSAMTASVGLRHSLHVAYQRTSMMWGGWRDYVRRARQPGFAEFMSAITADQRSMIGFPPVGHPYWTPAAIAAVGARYPEMDMSVYEGRSM